MSETDLFRSQFGQDRYIFQELMPFRGGTFLEAGAWDGEELSNTYFFEKALGWSGVLVEMQKRFFPAIQAKRPHSRCVNCALSEDRAERLYVDAGDRSCLLTHMDHRLVQQIERLFCQNKSAISLSWIDAIPLMDILDEAGVSKIDYFSLDVEGAEIDILRTIDFDRLRVNLFSIEDVFGGGQVLDEFLRPLGYQMLNGNIGPDRFFVRQDFLAELMHRTGKVPPRLYEHIQG